jgi:hypothetical protein
MLEPTFILTTFGSESKGRFEGFDA